ncbi:hypothetical protein ONZ51_g246 [Trametes cubensis]|uniref:Uncharacterized protein n=1 Tax=Trametes cubensis TaxID=1111947 RepID=A0AAD7U3U9_9APHY|nr:hypothetical protein ONZ51_g246 [Trametes cubensis]
MIKTIRFAGMTRPDPVHRFSDYASSYDCESTSVGSFPKPLPSGTVIPAWAYLPLTSDGKLDIAKAENGANEGSGEVSTPSVASQSSSQGVSKLSQTSASPPTSNTNGVTPTATGAQSQTDGHAGTQASTSTPSGSTASTTSDTLQATGSDSRVSDANALSTVVSTKTQASTATITTTGPTGAVALPAPENPTSERRISKAAVAGAIVAAIVLVTSSTIIGTCVYRRWSRRQLRKVAEGIEGERRKSQEGLRDGAQASPEAISPHDLKFYDPDDPDTYPPPMSEILLKAVHPLLSPNRLPAQV